MPVRRDEQAASSRYGIYSAENSSKALLGY